MKRIFCLGLCLVMMSGCAAMTTVDTSGFYNEASGNYFAVKAITTRDRTGTDLHHQMVMNNKDEIVDRATASGRGIVAGMTDGTGSALVTTGGTLGAAAMWPSDNYFGGNSTSDSGAVAAGGEGGAGGAGGSAVAHGGAGGNAGAIANVTNKPTFTNNNNVKNNVHNNIHNNVKNNVHNNVHNKGGWTPPGQNK